MTETTMLSLAEVADRLSWSGGTVARTGRGNWTTQWGRCAAKGDLIGGSRSPWFEVDLCAAEHLHVRRYVNASMSHAEAAVRLRESLAAALADGDLDEDDELRRAVAARRRFLALRTAGRVAIVAILGLFTIAITTGIAMAGGGWWP